jgi:hypothetical protein
MRLRSRAASILAFAGLDASGEGQCVLLSSCSS